MSIFDVVIIGGGASGAVCAAMLAKAGKTVCVVDMADSLAKKLLVTGNGRCNITNQNMDSGFYNQNIDGFLSVFNQQKTVSFFNSLGVELYADAEGRYYPVSNTAKSVVFALQNSCQKHGVNFLGGEMVIDVVKQSNYVVKTNTQTLTAKNVVFACGCNNQITNVVNNFGIKTKPYVPSLVALKTKQSTKRLDGIRISDVKVVAECEENRAEQFGEVLFKQQGLSGICIFNLSTLFARNNFCGKICIDILPKMLQTQITSILKRNTQIFNTATEMLFALLHKELTLEVLKQAGIQPELLTKNLTDEQICIIAKTIKNLQFDIVGHYDNNQVYSGGVLLTELTNNLQSKQNSGMYFCGEICDVDGECGGYNLQWAFTSAYVVAQDLINNK